MPDIMRNLKVKAESILNEKSQELEDKLTNLQQGTQKFVE